MNTLRAIEVIAVVGSLIAMIIGGFVYLEERHASRKALLSTELEVKSESLEADIEDDAARAVHYRREAQERGLSNPEKSRLEYLEKELDRKYKQQDRLQEALIQLEAE